MTSYFCTNINSNPLSMKSIVIAIVFSIMSIASFARSFNQSVNYGYDACGNRVLRQVVLGKFNKSVSADSQQQAYSEEQLGVVQVRIYPNPTHGRLKVMLATSEELCATIEVFDMQGRRVCHLASSNQENDIDLSSQPDGIYLMRLTVGGEQSTWRILKQ